MNLNLKIIFLIKKYKYLALAILIFVLYFYSMILFPLYKGEYKWKYLHQVWLEWQTLNAAMIALLASAIAIYSTIYTKKKDDERSLIAAKSRLAFALSSLMEYSNNLCNHYATQFYNFKKGGVYNKDIAKADEFSLDYSIIEILKECIQHADINESKHLSNILNNLQVANSRIKNYLSSKENFIITIHNIRSELLFVGNIIFSIDSSYDYARGESKINFTEPDNAKIIEILFLRFQVKIE